MKLPCEMIQDLLPLYEEELCSKKSKEAVEEHLKECSHCRNQIQNIKILSVSEKESEQLFKEEHRATTKSFRKIRQKWLLSLIVMFFIVPILILTINQARGRGICYTNADEILVARKFVQALEEQDAKKAFAMTNFKEGYEQIINSVGNQTKNYLSRYVSVFIGEEEWMLEKEIYESDFQNKQQIGVEFWEEALLGEYLFVIPIDIWNNIVLKYPNNFEILDEKSAFLINKEGEVSYRYEHMETEWGTYMVEETHAVWEAESPADFCCYVDLVPITVYQQALPEMEKRAEEDYLLGNTYYAEVLQMENVEEYQEMMQKRQSEKLEEQMKAGFTFQGTGYKESMYLTSRYYERVSERWQIVYGVDVTYEGKNYPISIEMEIVDGEIVTLGMSCNSKYLEAKTWYPLYRALMMTYMK